VPGAGPLEDIFIGSCTAHPATCDVVTKLPKWYSVPRDLWDLIEEGATFRYGDLGRGP
jgi:hypothetical protein